MMPTLLPSVTARIVRRSAAGMVMLSLTLFLLLALVGCQQTVPSPFSGQDVTAEQLVREADAEARKLEREATEKAEVARKRIEAAKYEARSRIREIRANVETTAAEAARVTESVQDELGVKVAEAEQDFSAAVARLEADTADLEARTNSALSEIEAKRSKFAAAFGLVSKIPVVGQAAASVGIDPTAIGALLFGGGALAWQSRRAKRREDTAWDDAKKEADEARAREHAAWEEAQTAMLRMHFPSPITKP